MADKFDAECLEAAVLEIIQNNLPTKLGDIDAEKADGIILPVVSNADYFNAIGQQVINVDPFIYYGIDDTTPESIGSQSGRQYTIFYAVFFMDDYSGVDVRKKSFRYIRALKEVVEENFRRIRSASSLELETVLPKDETLQDKSTWYKVGGIRITTTIAGG